ncbi:hypothetical protein D3C77_709540 [compost metagenome]
MQVNLAVTNNRRPLHRQIVTRRQRHVIAAQQRAFFLRGVIFPHRVGGGLRQEPFLGLGFFEEGVVAFGSAIERQIAPGVYQTLHVAIVIRIQKLTEVDRIDGSGC